MATRWCPACRSEYREAFAMCADCAVGLVDVLPPVEQSRPAPVHRVPRDDPLVELGRFGAVEAEMIASQLRSGGIDAVVLGVGTAGELSAVQFTEGSRVAVGRSEVDEARALLAEIGIDGGTALVDDDELGALAERAAGWTDPETGAVV